MALVELQINLADGYPTGEDIKYFCEKCGTLLPSFPDKFTACACGNIKIDVDGGRISVQDHSAFKVLIDQ